MQRLLLDWKQSIDLFNQYTYPLNSCECPTKTNSCFICFVVYHFDKVSMFNKMLCYTGLNANIFWYEPQNKKYTIDARNRILMIKLYPDLKCITNSKNTNCWVYHKCVFCSNSQSTCSVPTITLMLWLLNFRCLHNYS